MHVHLKDIAEIAAVAAFFWGIYVYFTNSRLRRAEWIASLYEKFYESKDLKAVRDKLDCGTSPSAEIENLIKEEPRDFTDYLNFFEFVAVLQKSRQLTDSEIEDLFGYYLDCLEYCQPLRDYIGGRGYEQLDRLLNRRKNKS